jgi:hypothetical protein
MHFQFFFYRLHKLDVISHEWTARKRNTFRSGRLNLSLVEPERIFGYLCLEAVYLGQKIDGGTTERSVRSQV